jgi:type II secretory pathway pseudopilin PulG
MFDFLGDYADLADYSDYSDLAYSADDLGSAADTFNAAADSAASYADGSAFATAADWQDFAPTEYDYSQLISELSELEGSGELPDFSQSEPYPYAPPTNAPPPGALSQVEHAQVDQTQAGPHQSPNAYKLPSEFDKNEVTTTDKLLRGLGIQDKNGNFDISNPKTLDAMMKLILGGGSALNALFGGNKTNQAAQSATSVAQTATQLREQAAGPYDKFTPQQQEWATKYFNTPSTPRRTVYAADMPSPVRYANGGSVGALSIVEGPVRGDGGGQDDIVDAKLAPGEWIADADFVSAVGDGSNDEGARRLDELRENLRRHKRSADPREIPPETGHITRFMPRGALSQMGG